jgi:hypothetical protein
MRYVTPLGLQRCRGDEQLLKPIDYEILRQFVRYGTPWTAIQLADFLGEPTRKIAGRFLVLLRDKLIYCPGLQKQRYRITDLGRDALDNAKQSPHAGQDPGPWIARARAGIDSQGRQTRLDKCAIPKPTKHPLSYEMDLDAYIDAKRAGELDG